MGSTRDFIAATLADSLLPLLRRPVEDIIYQTIDDRQIPSRSDFRELRDLANSLRGQLTGAVGGVKRLADRIEALEDELSTSKEAARQLQTEVEGLRAELAGLREGGPATEPLAGEAVAPDAGPAKPEKEESPANEPPEVTAEEHCAVTDCDQQARARGFCARHYQQWRRGKLEGFPRD